jgi:hypothetical protein
MSATNSITKSLSPASSVSDIKDQIANHINRSGRNQPKRKSTTQPERNFTPVPLWDRKVPKPYYGPYTPLGQSAQLPNQDQVTKGKT